MFRLQTAIQAHERVVLFPTYAYRSADGCHWHVDVHGWIFVTKERSLVHNGLFRLLRSWLGLKDKDIESATLRTRLRPFVADNRHGKHVAIRLGQHVYQMPESQPNGHFRHTLEIPVDVFETLRHENGQDTNWLSFQLLLPDGDPREITGRFELISERGISVITDIDDTIKITGVTNRRELLMNTFLREFRVVPSMSAVFQRLAEHGASFHYVSSSPWQLFEPLGALFEQDGFPAGSFHLRNFRLKDGNLQQYLAGSEEQKRAAIEEIFAAFPQRQFVFFGDSGEQDPELYVELAQRYPEKILRICIRNSHGEMHDDDRFARIFKDLANDRWVVFDDANELLSDERWMADVEETKPRMNATRLTSASSVEPSSPKSDERR
ncbi:MAG: phosphatase domain-containing protein [Planctomycetaceae bacterium]